MSGGVIAVSLAGMKMFSMLMCFEYAKSVVILTAFAAVLGLGLPKPAHAQDATVLARGEMVFRRDCAGCHDVGPKARNGVGPHLNGLFGRTAAGVAEFKFYSKALKESGLVWTKDNFATFIENPRDMVINTKQVFDGLKDKNEIAALTAYLAQF